MNAIEIEHLKKYYGEVKAVDDISFSVGCGEFFAFLGVNGAGKSTTISILCGRQARDGGSVRVGGMELDSHADEVKRRLGVVFQSFHLIPSLDVAANVELPLIYRSGLSARQRKERVEQVLERLEMTHRIHHLPSQLSGGQCQRVAIARAIVGQPQIVLADEPTGNLDSKMGAEVMGLLHRLNKEDGTTIVMVTHNEAQAMETDRIVRFFDGRIIG